MLVNVLYGEHHIAGKCLIWGGAPYCWLMSYMGTGEHYIQESNMPDCECEIARRINGCYYTTGQKELSLTK